ncbi:MAG: GntR family transcriptional regulator [Oscillospiraceae bacterium]|nr:GntR family transcriptional regulator [Oscillospiraceae bacterium]
MEWIFRPDAPIYTQLYEHLTLAIVSGTFPPGGRLPAVRELAVDAGVNPNTVQRALSELERDGLVYSQRTTGRYVTDDAERIEQERRKLAEGRARDFLAAMQKLGYDRVQTVVLLEKMRGERKEQ